MKKRFKRYLCFALSILFGVFAFPASTAVAEEDDREVKGLFVDFYDNLDYGSGNELGESGLKARLTEIVNFAADSGLNTLYVKVFDNGEAIYSQSGYGASSFVTEDGDLPFDLLEYTIEAAKVKGMDVVAWVNPWRLPQGGKGITYENQCYADISDKSFRDKMVSEIQSLAANYDISAILVETDFYPAADFEDGAAYASEGGGKSLGEFRQGQITDFVRGISEKLDGGAVGFGVMPPATAYTTNSTHRDNGGDYSAVPQWAAQGLVDFVVPQMDMAIRGTIEKDYLYYLDKWDSLMGELKVDWRPAVFVSKVDDYDYDDPYEIDVQILAARNTGADGVVLHSYAGLEEEEAYVIGIKGIIEGYKGIFRSGQPNLVIDNSFRVTRPRSEITWEGSNYYIMGMGAPGSPVYCNGQEVEYRGSQGSFGIYVSLSAGTNTFTVTQGDKSETVSIVYTPPTTTTTPPQAITEIVQSSMYPTYSDVAKVGEVYEIRCTAPSGLDVTADVAGETVALEQTADADYGMPATYSGSLVIPDKYRSDAVVNDGTVTYTLYSAGGTTTEYTSHGYLYVAGKDADIQVRSKSFMTNIYPEPKKSYDYYSVMHKGTTDLVTDQTSDMFLLSQGGYVYKDEVTVVTGEYEGLGQVEAVTFSTTYRTESLRFSGAKNAAFAVDLGSETVSVKLRNITGVDGSEKAFSILEAYSSLFDKVTVTEDETGILMEFGLREGKEVWGYDVESYGNDTWLTFTKKPVLSGNDEKPLEGITLVVDPGHGGSDPGAIGPAYDEGPMEKDLTLATGLKLQEYLEEMGATVYMTRREDASVELYERAAFFQKMKPDFFISVHINSTAESSNGGEADGTEIYYFTPQSEQFAENILAEIGGNTGRNMRFTEQAVYVVTRPTVAPGVLCELGFINNPVQYEDMADSETIDATARAIAEAARKTLENRETPPEED